MKLSDVLLDGFQKDDSHAFDIKTFFFQYLRYWWVFVLGVIISVTAAFYYLFYATPQYAISSSLLIKSDNGPNFSRNAIFSDLEAYATTNTTENELEVIGSFSLMRDAIEDLPLHASFFIEDKYSRKMEMYGTEVPIEVVIHNKNDGDYAIPEDNFIKIHLEDEDLILETSLETSKIAYGDTIKSWFGTISVNKSPSFRLENPTILLKLNNKDALAAAFSSALSIELPTKLSSVVKLSLNDPVPQRGKDVLNKLVETYSFQAVKEKNIIATNTLEFIEEQLESLTEELDDIERKIESYRRT